MWHEPVGVCHTAQLCCGVSLGEKSRRSETACGKPLYKSTCSMIACGTLPLCMFLCSGVAEGATAPPVPWWELPVPVPEEEPLLEGDPQ